MLDIALQLGLSKAEFNRIVQILGREPNYTELGIFSVMWSEHCSYKSSSIHLRRFPKSCDRIIAEPGMENAGALRLKDNWAVVFKAESHNHPSAIEPFQGAATGVGGILRDVFCMGAYPIACLNSLRFGELDNPVVKHLFDGVVRGIASYGNCFGVPTVGGEVYFEPSYTGNPIVNAMAVGLVQIDKMISAKAKGPGNPVVYIGSSTGRDGIHGASFASFELSETSDKDRPSVQIGDPFTEKILLEATQEIAIRNLAIGMQDMGAAGLTSSSAELAAKGGVGIELDLDKVPLRETGMTPYEIMLSESQERMLLITEKKNLSEIESILKKWDLNYSVVGKVIKEHVLRLLWRNEIVGEIPTNSLQAGDGAPIYNLPQAKPILADDAQSEKCDDILDKISIKEVLPKLLGMPSIASKRWVYQQYDYQVGARTVMLPGNGDAAVLRIPETGQFLSVSIDGNGAYCYLDPYIGAAIAVLEAARNVAATGARPIGITDCLNYGNPQKPEVMYQFSRGVDGISDACRALSIPVTGGNVSFYNESPKDAIFPTPTIGMIGLIENESYITPMAFQKSADSIIILGETGKELEGSQIQKLLCGSYSGKPPEARIKEHNRIINFLLELIHEGKIHAAHDVSEGGIAISLSEMCINSIGIGAEINLPNYLDSGVYLFSESQGRFICEVNSDYVENILQTANKKKIMCEKIGTTIDDPYLKINKQRFDIEELKEVYESSIKNAI